MQDLQLNVPYTDIDLALCPGIFYLLFIIIKY